MYEYQVRRGYGSELMLIEFTSNATDQKFFDQLIAALKRIGSRLTDVHDLWINDEILLHFQSEHGSFLVSKDIWDCVFVLAPGNQASIAQIDSALMQSGNFKNNAGRNRDQEPKEHI